MASINDAVVQQKIRSYEISIWTLQDRFISVLRWSTMEHKGQLQAAQVVLRDDGTQELSFSIPKFYQDGINRVLNPMWTQVQNQPIEANMQKLKVIFNKNTDDEEVFEFLVTSVTSGHTGDQVDIEVKAEGLAFHELGKIGYKIALSEDEYVLAVDKWANSGMVGDMPQNTIQYWNDLVFKDSHGNWRTNWTYEVRMNWGSYSNSKTKSIDKVYEDEYVSSWQIKENDTELSPRFVEGTKEKCRIVNIRDSNIYNITQTIAESFGVFCRYEYEHDDNYQICGRKVIYYNNYIYDADGHIDLTYPYSSSGITRTVDNSNLVTKLYVPSVEEDTTTYSIMEVDANKSREDYLLCFDYMLKTNAINQDQYDEISKYETKMHQFNKVLEILQGRIKILEDQLVLLEADQTTYTNAVSLDTERYNEAKKGQASITGGNQSIPVDATFILMEDTANGWGKYIRLRFEGIDINSIHLYGRSNYTVMNGEQYSMPINSWNAGCDPETGEVLRIQNIQVLDTEVKVGDTVFLQGRRNPYTYYTELMRAWSERLAADQQKLDETEAKIKEYKQYLYGLEEASAEYQGLAVVTDGQGQQQNPYVNSTVGEARIGGAGESTDLDFDHFALLDLSAEAYNLVGLRDMTLRAKADEINKFDRMMGPALREGYWQPDDYHNYGDSFQAQMALSIGQQNVGRDGFFEFIPQNEIMKSQVWATPKDDRAVPHLQQIWDCNKYYENEEPLIYTVGIDGTQNQHMVVNLNGHLSQIANHLDDLCFFYYDPANVETQIDIQVHKRPDIVHNLTCLHNNRQMSGESFNNGRRHIFGKIRAFLTRLQSSHTTLMNRDASYMASKNVGTLQKITGYLNHAANLINTICNDSSQQILWGSINESMIQAAVAQIDTLADCSDDLYAVLALYNEVKSSWESARNNAANSTTIANLNTAINEINAQLTLREHAYDYLTAIDQYTLGNARYSSSTFAANSSGYSTGDHGLLTLLRQYQTYVNWQASLAESAIYGYQINSQCELGWVLNTNYQNNEHQGEYITPALIVHGAKVLDNNTFKKIVTNSYEGKPASLNVAPFIGYYITEEQNGQTKIRPQAIFSLTPSDFLGTNYLAADCRTVPPKIENTQSGEPEQKKVSEYELQRVYPRFFFDTLKLKVADDELHVNINGSPLANVEDFSVISDDRSFSTITCGTGYYLTIKAPVLFKYGAQNSSTPLAIDLLYTFSNADVSIYLDAIKVMRENAYPKVSYDVQLSILNPEFIRTAYKRLNQIVHINDNDLDLEEVSGYISALTLDLDMPWQDDAEIKNYETKFEDLFTTIVAQTEAMKKSSQGLDTVLQAFSRTTGLLNEDVFYNSMLSADLNLSFNKGKLTIDQKEGIWGTSDEGVVAFRGGGIFTATQRDSNGGWIWNTGILPSGINASLITTGQLDTNKIKIYSGDELRFQWSGDGLYAYKSYTYDTIEAADSVEGQPIRAINQVIDPLQYIIFNSDGLFLTARAGATYPTGVGQTISGGKPVRTYGRLDKTIQRVEVSWDGFKLRDWTGKEVFYADPDTGNLTLTGRIESNSGVIGGWTLSSDAFIGSKIELLSQGENAGIRLTDKEILEEYEFINGERYYKYIYDGNSICFSQTKFEPNGNQPYVIQQGDVIYIHTQRLGSVYPTRQETETVTNSTNITDNASESGVATQNGESIIVVGGSAIGTTQGANMTTTIYFQVKNSQNNWERAKFNGVDIVYDRDTNPTTTNGWYAKVKAAYPNTYRQSVAEIYVDDYTTTNSLVGKSVTRMNTSAATFSVSANTGYATILNGKIGNFNLTKDGLSNGSLSDININATSTVGSSNITVGSLFSDFTMTSDGQMKFTRVDGTELNFNMAETQFYKDGCASAGQIILDVQIADSKVTATARSGSGVEISKVLDVPVVYVETGGGGGGGGGGSTGCTGNSCGNTCSGECGTACSGACTNKCQRVGR